MPLNAPILIGGFYQIQALTNISTEIKLKDDKFDATPLIQEALLLTRFEEDWNKCTALFLISLELEKQGNFEEANKVMGEALEYANSLDESSENHVWRDGLEDSDPFLLLTRPRIFKDISSELGEIGNYEKAAIIMKIFLEKKPNGIYENRYYDNLALLIHLAQKGKIKEVVEYITNKLQTYYGQSGRYFNEISCELADQGKYAEALEVAQNIDDEDFYYEEITLEHIFIQLAVHGKFVEALEVVQNIEGKEFKNSALKKLSIALAKQGKNVESHEAAVKISNKKDKNRALKYLSIELAKQGKVNDAISCVNEITAAGQKCIAQIYIYSALIKNSKDEAGLLLKAVLDYTKQINTEDDKYIDSKHLIDKQNLIEEISIALAINGMINEALGFLKSYDDTDALIQDMSSELAKRGMFDEALLCVSEINDVYSKCVALNLISTEMAIIGKFEESDTILKESLDLAYGIKDYKELSHVLKNIFIGLAEIKDVESVFFLIEEAIVCASRIHDNTVRRKVLNELYIELALKGLIEEVIEYSREMDTLSDSSMFLKSLSLTLASRGKLPFAEKIGLEISEIGLRQSCWKEMAKSIKIKNGWESALTNMKELQNDESIIFYLQGLIENLSVNETDINCFKTVIPLIVKDPKNIQTLLQCLALHELMYGKPTKEMIQRFNKTLNIQWAIDIADKFPKEIEEGRFSNNLESWIQEIADEDDRDQIELWARQVLKGKLSEEEFKNNLESI
jgi:hypothetical protein